MAGLCHATGWLESARGIGERVAPEGQRIVQRGAPQPQALPLSSDACILVCTSHLLPGALCAAQLLHDVERQIKFPVRILGDDWTLRIARRVCGRSLCGAVSRGCVKIVTIVSHQPPDLSKAP